MNFKIVLLLLILWPSFLMAEKQSGKRELSLEELKALIPEVQKIPALMDSKFQESLNMCTDELKKSAMREELCINNFKDAQDGRTLVLLFLFDLTVGIGLLFFFLQNKRANRQIDWWAAKVGQLQEGTDTKIDTSIRPKKTYIRSYYLLIGILFVFINLIGFIF